MGGRQKVEVPTGGRPGWGEGACSASDEAVRAGVCAASEGSEWVAQGPGLEPGFHVDQQAVPENSWVPAAYAAHFERPAAGSGVDAGLRPGLRGLRALDKATEQKRKKQTNKKKNHYRRVTLVNYLDGIKAVFLFTLCLIMKFI